MSQSTTHSDVIPRPCIDCQKLTTNTSRCGSCESIKQSARNKARLHYRGTYRTRAKKVRENAKNCWVCGLGALDGDPFQADHVNPGDPNSELLAAHRSCNIRRTHPQPKPRG